MYGWGPGGALGASWLVGSIRSTGPGWASEVLRSVVDVPSAEAAAIAQDMINNPLTSLGVAAAADAAALIAAAVGSSRSTLFGTSADGAADGTLGEITSFAAASESAATDRSRLLAGSAPYEMEAVWTSHIFTSGGLEATDVPRVLVVDPASDGDAGGGEVLRITVATSTGDAVAANFTVTVGGKPCNRTLVVGADAVASFPAQLECAGTPPGGGTVLVTVVTPVVTYENGSKSGGDSGGSGVYVYRPATLERTSRVDPGGGNGTLSLWGSYLGHSDSAIVAELALSSRSVDYNIEWCAAHGGSSGSCIVRATASTANGSALTWDSPSRVFFDPFAAAASADLDGGLPLLALFGDDAGEVRLTIDGVPAQGDILSDDSGDVFEWPIVATRAPLVYAVEPAAAYRNQLVTITGRNFGGVAPNSCKALAVMLSGIPCSVLPEKQEDGEGAAAAATATDVGWANDGRVVCRVTGGITGQPGSVVLTRDDLSNPGRSVLFEYLGRQAPPNVDDLLALVQASDEPIKLSILCGSGLGLSFDIDSTATRESLVDLLAGACGDSDTITSLQVVPAIHIEVQEVVGDAHLCDALSDGTNWTSGNTNCDTRGSGSEMGVEIFGQHFMGADGTPRVESASVGGKIVLYDIISEESVRIQLPPMAGKDNWVTLRDTDGFVDFTGRISYRPPNIIGTRGCNDGYYGNTNITDTCPLDGAVSVTVVGTSFGGRDGPGMAARVLIGAAVCLGVKRIQLPGFTDGIGAMTCTLPDGAGSGGGGWLAVTALVGNQASDPVASLRYDPCPVGTYWRNRQRDCRDCAIGRYTPGAGMQKCLLCAPGRFSPSLGVSECDACDAGRHQPNAGETECAACEPGLVQPAEGQRSCKSCSPGMFVAEAEQLVCDRCDEGFFQSSRGGTDCTPCPAGEYTDTTGAALCKACPPGFFCPGGAPQSLCPSSMRSGTFCSQPGGLFAAPCPAMYHCPAPTSKRRCSDAQLCPVGTGVAPRECIDNNAFVNATGSGESYRPYCACGRGFFGVMQPTAAIFEAANMTALHTLDWDLQEKALADAMRALWPATLAHHDPLVAHMGGDPEFERFMVSSSFPYKEVHVHSCDLVCVQSIRLNVL